MTIRRAIIVSLIVVSCLGTVLQWAIDSSSSNIAASCMVLVSALAMIAYLGWTDAIVTRPLSTFALFGFCFTTQLGAMLAQTAAWTPLVSSLYDPLYTFSTLAFYQAIAMLVHMVYRFFSVPRPPEAHLARGLLEWAGLYRTPSPRILWTMGFIGLLAFFGWHFDNLIGKISVALNFLALAPFMLLFYLRSEGEGYANAKVQRIGLAIYTFAAVVCGLALNVRAVMFLGVVTLALNYFLSGLRSNAQVSARGVLRLAMAAVVIVIISAPISDLATSMVIARQWRGKVSSAEMIRTTVYVWRNPSLIAAYKAEGEQASKFRAYDEHYISNPLLARFINTKFHDNAFHFSRAISSPDARARLREISIDLAWAGLPDPLLHVLHIAVNKDELTGSMGDYLAYLGRGIPMGGHKVGSMFAQGIALFGPFFPFVYAVLCLALYALLELLTVKPARGSVAALSALGMMDIMFVFGQGLSYEGLHDVVYLFIRNFAQMVLIYLVIAAFVRSTMRDEPSSPPVPKLTTWQHS